MQHETLQAFDDVGRMIPGGIHTEIKYRAAVKGAGQWTLWNTENFPNLVICIVLNMLESRGMTEQVDWQAKQ